MLHWFQLNSTRGIYYKKRKFFLLISVSSFGRWRQTTRVWGELPTKETQVVEVVVGFTAARWEAASWIRSETQPVERSSIWRIQRTQVQTLHKDMLPVLDVSIVIKRSLISYFTHFLYRNCRWWVDERIVNLSALRKWMTCENSVVLILTSTHRPFWIIRKKTMD